VLGGRANTEIVRRGEVAPGELAADDPHELAG
jgi:hypothetical protein